LTKPLKQHELIRLQVLLLLAINVTVFWDVTGCEALGICHLHFNDIISKLREEEWYVIKRRD
jgi:hypothetical protein